MRPYNIDIAQPTTTEQLYAHLRRLARSQPAHTQLLSERRLAQQHGVSHSTVRRVVGRLVADGLLYKKHGKGIFVSPPTKGPKADRSTIMYISEFRDPNHQFYARLLLGLTEQANEHDFRIQLHHVSMDSFLNDEILLDEVARDEVAGVIMPWVSKLFVAGANRVNPDLRYVSLEADFDDENGTSVAVDIYFCGRKAITHVIDQGCRSIACVYSTQSFLAGARDVIWREEGIELFEFPHDSARLSDGIAPAILASHADAIIFYDDRQAQHVLLQINELAPGYLDTHPVVSGANYGEDLLPPQVARLLLDGRDIGVLSMRAMAGMLEHRPIGRTAMRVRPRLLLPDV